MATTTNYGWTTPDDTALVKDGASSIRTLGTSVDTTTKNLNPQTTLGDIAYRSSTSNVNTRLALGTANQILRVNSGATAPEWATPTAGGMTLLSTTTLSGATTTISSIDQTYTDLKVLGVGISNASNAEMFLRINGNTGSNYYWQYLQQEGGVNYAAIGTAQTGIQLGHQNSQSAYDLVGTVEFTINRYTQTEYKGIEIFLNTANSGNPNHYVKHARLNSTAAITSLTFYNGTAVNFNAGTIYIYGVK